ncbi:hypothetical protein HY440_03155 [Candidatus Microgenomates bacterium]|nr:hypothetical protein [Candidatus Microgenomates bacterium]
MLKRLGLVFGGAAGVGVCGGLGLFFGLEKLNELRSGGGNGSGGETETPTRGATAGPRPTDAPLATGTPAAGKDTPAPTATTTATVASIPDVVGRLKSAGVKVEISDSHPDWPKTYTDAAKTLSSGNGRAVKPEQMVPVVEPDNTWRGWWAGEAGFPFKSGIRFDNDRGYHVDASGKPLFNTDSIFDFSKAPKPEDLVDVRLSVHYAGFFARRGGVTRDGLPQHTSYFAGNPGASVAAVEQFTLIPVPKELCPPQDWTQGAVIRSYRMGVASFRDNKDAREGFVDGGVRKYLQIQWFNPEKNKFEILDGRLISRLAREGRDLSIIERLPAGWPVAPETVSARFGGRPDGWVFEPKTGEWFFEAFPLLNGVSYVQGTGHMNGSGSLLVGAEQADGSKTKVFNFKAQPVGMAENMYAPGIMSGLLYVRVGDAASNANVRHNSWYTSGKGNVLIGSPAIEQATAMPLGQTGCPVSEVEQQKIDIMRQRAKDQSDPLVRAWYWDGGKFVPAK